MTRIRIKIPLNENHYDMFIWLNRYFGPNGERWTVAELSYIDFLNSKDALFFSLRWP